ncbi:FUSC family protein [Streptomyces sp. MS1.AVA.4]|uniref:FUSC family protein n=1 Tax=Streptomyces pratisoli TaxID=3139917 RepID=A0ACC6QQP9_9ACTN
MKSGAERTAILHRSLRVSLAATAGFYPFLYGLQEPTVALYALFAPIALGLLSSIPGSGRQRAEVMLKALPVGLLLVTLGTALAVRTWAAVLGMLVIGFMLAFAAVAGPRPAGAAPGLQLFYILACFPPYAPDTLGLRLAGLTAGVLLLAACERFLLPEPADVSYRESLAEAVAVAGAAARGNSGASPESLREAGARLRFSYLPAAERPAGPGRKDRAHAQAGSAARRLLEQLAHLTETGVLPASGLPCPDTTAPPGRVAGTDPGPDGDAGSGLMLRQVAALCGRMAAALRAGRAGVAGPDRMDEAVRGFQQLRVRQATGPAAEVPPVPVLRRQAALVAVAESARMLEASVRVGLDGTRTAPIPPQGLFWYADAPTAVLWYRRIAGNMTLHSVQFQNAVRIALGLGAARLVAGSLDLAHGFWVLLAVLTLSRTTVGETWTAIRQAVAGTLVGAVAAGALLVGLGGHTVVFAVLLAPGMLVAFALGPLLGIAWAQGLFTLVVATAFAQIAPASWQLAEERIVDVLAGSAVGLLCGLLAWPAGARREVRKAMAGLLRATGPLITGTAAAVTTAPPGSVPPPATLVAFNRLRLAEAAYAQFRSEPAGSTHARADWHAVLIVANHILVGAHWLPRFDLPERALPAGAADRACSTAGRAAATADRLAALCGGERPPPLPPPGPASAPPGGRPLPALVDLELWLDGVAAQLRGLDGVVPGTFRRAGGDTAPRGGGDDTARSVPGPGQPGS